MLAPLRIVPFSVKRKVGAIAQESLWGLRNVVLSAVKLAQPEGTRRGRGIRRKRLQVIGDTPDEQTQPGRSSPVWRADPDMGHG
jgi:hypothetical protein